MCSYFRHISLCFYSNFDWESSLDAELDSVSIEYPHCILLMDPATSKTRNTWKNVMMMWVPTLQTFDGPRYAKNKKYLKKRDDGIIITFFQVFLIFGVEGSVKSMQWGPSKVFSVGTCYMRNQIPHPMISPDRNLSKNTGRYVENTNTKSSFFILPPKLITIILLFSLGGPF